MNAIKSIIAKKTIKFKVIESTVGKCIIKVDTMTKAKTEISTYDYLLNRVPKIINGIEKVSLDYDKLTADISYDNKKISEERILEILEVAKELIIDNFDYIEENYENDLEKVIDSIEKKLKEKLEEK